MALSVVPQFLYRQFFVTPPVPSQDCTGKTIIITGSNVGLGKEAARHYVRLNCAKLILACRSIDKGQAAKEEILKSTGVKNANIIDVWPLDLQNYDSVRAFAKRASSELDRIDILIENAGISTGKFYSVGGNESTVTVNVVATFLLALLMLPKLRDVGRKYSFTPTLTIVSSEVHFFTSFPERKSPSIFATLNTEKDARMADRYNVSKLLEVFSCREIAKHHPVEQMGVTLNFVNPGWCHSELMREITNPVITIIKFLLCRTTEVGSRTLVDAGLKGKESHGKYLTDCKMVDCAPLVEGPEGPETQRRVWQELSEQLESIEPGVTKVLDG